MTDEFALPDWSCPIRRSLEIGRYGWLVVAYYGSHVVEFAGYECQAIREAAPAGLKLYSRRNPTPSDYLTDRVEDAEPSIEGSVKWDGCIDFYFNENHFCCVQDVTDFGQVLLALHELCRDLDTVDEGCAGYRGDRHERTIP